MGVGTAVLTGLLLAGGRAREALSHRSTPVVNEGGAMSTTEPSRRPAANLARGADNSGLRLVYSCLTCVGVFGEGTAEAVLKRAAANRHGPAITPELEGLGRAA